MNVLSALIFDAPIIFSVIMCSFRGWKRGAVRPFINFLGSMVSLAASTFFSFHFARIAYDDFFKNILLNQVRHLCINDKIENFPKFFLFALRLCSVENNELARIILSGNPEMTIVNILSPFVINFLRFTVGSMLFGVVMIFVRRVSKFSNSIFKTPILSQLNSTLGAFFGIFKGVLISWIFALFLHIFLVYWDNPPKIFSQSFLGSTIIFVRFYNFNPITNNFMDNIANFCELDFLKWISNRK